MSLASGVRLGPYEVLRLIGAGGMGEVYRARDTRLNRTVAIKILSPEFALDPDRRARFEREARVVAALNHPHICSLLDVGETPNSLPEGSLQFFVMEYLDGHTLAERLLRGPLPAAELIQCSIELADAVDHAHRRGLLHRDLKPSNVMLTPSGAKLLDFGLSKAQSSEEALAYSTLSPGEVPLTTVGAVLGTYPYMSPEQLSGREVDARSDVFALGALVYEMATGRRAFDGTTAATVMGAVLHSDPPPVSTLQPLAPSGLDRVISRCLAKDPDNRWQTVRDLLLEFKWIAESKAEAPVTETAPTQQKRPSWAARLTVGTLVTLLALVLAYGLTYLQRSPASESVQRLSLLPPPGINMATLDNGGGAVISPDGERVAFVGIDADGKKFLWVRRLELLDAQQLPASEGAEYPFWSPDSRSIAFFAQGKLKSIAADGGPSLILCDSGPQPRGGAWNDEGTIVFSTDAGEQWYRVDSAGGVATRLAIDRPNGENYWPSFLPDGRHFIYFGRPQKPGIYVASLESNYATPLLAGEYVGVAYAPPGYLLTLAGPSRSSTDRALVARPFDAARLQITGEPFVLAEHVAYQTLSSRAAFSVSGNGRAIYESQRVPATELRWFDRAGTYLATLGDTPGYLRPSLSPDGRTVAAELQDTKTGATDIWLIETMRGVASRLSIDPASEWMPVWSPDGTHLTFVSPRGTAPALYQQDTRKAGVGELLLKTTRVLHSEDWSADGRFIAYALLDPKTQWDVWTLKMSTGTGTPQPMEPKPFLQTEFNEFSSQFSPDGNWMAYVSDESGTLDVYVRAFPSSDNRWRISNNGGSQPRWRHDGKELFYVAHDGTLMAVEIARGATFAASVPRPLFKTRITDTGISGMSYSVAIDGQRFLIHTITDDRPTWTTTVLLNWLALTKR